MPQHACWHRGPDASSPACTRAPLGRGARTPMAAAWAHLWVRTHAVVPSRRARRAQHPARRARGCVRVHVLHAGWRFAAHGALACRSRRAVRSGGVLRARARGRVSRLLGHTGLTPCVSVTAEHQPDSASLKAKGRHGRDAQQPQLHTMTVKAAGRLKNTPGTRGRVAGARRGRRGARAAPCAAPARAPQPPGAAAAGQRLCSLMRWRPRCPWASLHWPLA
jgi:hypothetical protein